MECNFGARHVTLDGVAAGRKKRALALILLQCNIYENLCYVAEIGGLYAI